MSGTAVGVMYRELTGDGREHLAKISLRSSGDVVDVSKIARSFNGGGHKQAAGATTELSYDDAIELIRKGVSEQLVDRASKQRQPELAADMRGGTIDCGVVLVDKPAGVTSFDVVYDVRRRLEPRSRAQGEDRPRRDAGPVCDGIAGRSGRSRDAHPAVSAASAEVVPRRCSARLDVGQRRQSTASWSRPGRVPADPQLPTGELDLAVPSYSAIKVDGQRLYAKARRGEDFEPPVRTMTVYRAERMDFSDDRATFEIDCAGGTYIRSVVAHA